MKLTQLQLENFRNYEALEIDLSKDQTIALVGPNAQGKTNFLESIAFLALGKSFRAKRYLETLGWDRPHGRIRATLNNGKKDTKLEIFMQREPEQKKVKKNEQLTIPADFLGTFRIVLFTPDTLLMVSGSPALRRQFFDRLLIQLNREYVEAFSHYQRILKQRNALLKRINFGQAQTWELDLWDAALVTEAERLWEAREHFVHFLEGILAQLYDSISGTKEVLGIHYKPHKDRLEEELMARRDSDIRSGSTSLGPHRDDFSLTLDGHILSETGSRGECRTAVLALKIAEIRFIEEKTKEKPLLLLDDVFSELDETRQAHLGKLIKDYQSIITTTSKEHLKGLKGARILEVEGGRFG